MADAQVVLLVPLAGSGNLPGHDLPTGPVYPSGQPLPGGGHPSGQPLPPGHVSGQPLPPGLPPMGSTLPELPPELNPPPPEVWPGVPIRPATPEHPIAAPPGTVYPPLPPSVTGKAICLVAVLGVGYRWVVLEVAQPKTA
jgi:hypothetical protein